MSNSFLPHDAHCHIESLDTINPKQNLAVAATKPEDIIKLASLRKLHSHIKIGIGLHPWYVNEDCDLIKLENNIVELIEEYKPDFIGECGLDKLKPNFEMQKLVTILHCKLAQKYSLPIVFHCVRSYNELLEIITNHPIAKGLLHAYNANRETAKQYAKKHISLGIGSSIMNENSQISRSIANIPLEQIVIESDAPYMPLLGKANSTVADCEQYFLNLCAIKKISPTETVELINNNWTKIYS